MKLTDEQLLDALRDAGHEESADVLAQKLTARSAVEEAARVPRNQAMNDWLRASTGRPTGRERGQR